MKLVVLSLLWGTSLGTIAKDSPWHMSMGISKWSFFYPSYHVFTGPLHPGISGSILKMSQQETRTHKAWVLETGFYHHDHFENGMYLALGKRYAFHPLSRLSYVLQPGIGYLYTYAPTGTYKLEHGRYTRDRLGHSSLLVGLTMGLQYALQTPGDPKLFLHLVNLATGPFATGWGVPVVPRTQLKAGVQIKLGQG